MIDDHTPFTRRGVPAIDLIDFDFPCWHKACDDLPAVSKRSLALSGRGGARAAAELAMRFSVGLPQLDADPALVAPYAARAEELGFDGLWALDSAVGGPTGHSTTLDGLQLLAARGGGHPRAAARHRGDRHHAPQPGAAGQGARLARPLSGGRLTAASGIGSSQPPPRRSASPPAPARAACARASR